MVTSKQKDKISKVIFRCPKCNKLINYIPSQKDLEKIGISGLASVSFNHGDHALLIYFDSNGKIRGWQIYESEVELVKLGLATWKRVNKWKRKPNGVNLLIATTEGLKYSDLYWHEETDWILNYISRMTKDIVKLKKNSKESYIFNTKPVFYAVLGKPLDLHSITKLGKFFYQLTEKFGDIIVNDETIQRVIVSIVKNIETPLITEEAIELITDLYNLARVKVKKKLIDFLLKTNDRIAKDPRTMSFIEAATKESGLSLRELVEAISLEEVTSLIKIYYKLKKLKVISVNYV